MKINEIINEGFWSNFKADFAAGAAAGDKVVNLEIIHDAIKDFRNNSGAGYFFGPLHWSSIKKSLYTRYPEPLRDKLVPLIRDVDAVEEAWPDKGYFARVWSRRGDVVDLNEKMVSLLSEIYSIIKQDVSGPSEKRPMSAAERKEATRRKALGYDDDSRQEPTWEKELELLPKDQYEEDIDEDATPDAISDIVRLSRDG